MKKQGVRTKISLVVIKALVSRSWCNESKGPGKILILFIGLNRLVEDEENLFLSLKLAEGKGFSDEAIHSLLKKEYHIPVGFLELKEQLRYIMVFHSLFNRMGRVTKEIKKVFDTISKRERLIGILFNKDLLAGARIIVVLDN